MGPAVYLWVAAGGGLTLATIFGGVAAHELIGVMGDVFRQAPLTLQIGLLIGVAGLLVTAGSLGALIAI